MRWTMLLGAALLVVGCADTEVPTAPDSEALARSVDDLQVLAQG